MKKFNDISIKILNKLLEYFLYNLFSMKNYFENRFKFKNSFIINKTI